MTKRLLSIILTVALCALLCACGEPPTDPGTAIDPADNEQQGTSQQNGGEPKVVDMSQLSSTMVYAELYSILSAPQDYIGATIIIKGAFTAYENSFTDVVYYSCIVTDAAACCSLGLEFVTALPLVYPDDYPAIGTEITVKGTFEMYAENGSYYCRIADSVLSWQSASDGN